MAEGANKQIYPLHLAGMNKTYKNLLLGDCFMKKETVVIIGGGLSGLTAASYLADVAAVTVLEQGKEYADRNPKSGEDVLIGLGGAGTLSGGKLCFPPASGGIWGKTNHYMPEFKTFNQHISSKVKTISPMPSSDCALSHNGHNGLIKKNYRTELVLQDSMHMFIVNQIHELRNKGVIIRSGCRVKQIVSSRNGYNVIFTDGDNRNEAIPSTYVIVATGRTSVPFLQQLFGDNYYHQPDLGIRFSIDTSQHAFAAVGEDVKLKQKTKDYLIRTFCVCCGGDIIKTSTRGQIHYDGHFKNQLTGITNLGILARSPRYSGPQAVDDYLQSMQKYVNAEMSLRDFMRYYRLVARKTPYEELFEALNSFVLNMYQSGLLVQNADEIPVMLPAVDRINPLIYTNNGFESRVQNVYLTGDASGVSRGFVQAMWAGYCTAERISERILCKEKEKLLVV